MGQRYSPYLTLIKWSVRDWCSPTATAQPLRVPRHDSQCLQASMTSVVVYIFYHLMPIYVLHKTRSPFLRQTQQVKSRREKRGSISEPHSLLKKLNWRVCQLSFFYNLLADPCRAKQLAKTLRRDGRTLSHEARLMRKVDVITGINSREVKA